MELRYDNEECNEFVEDMTEVGYEVEHYRGRYFWEGPAVRASNLEEYHEIVRATAVKLQRDNLGLGWIVYPVKAGLLINKEG